MRKTTLLLPQKSEEETLSFFIKLESPSNPVPGRFGHRIDTREHPQSQTYVPVEPASRYEGKLVKKCVFLCHEESALFLFIPTITTMDPQDDFVDSGGRGVNEAFRKHDEETDYCRPRRDMIDMQEHLLRRFQAEREQLNTEMAARVQSLPDDKEEMQSTHETKFVKQPKPLQRPGPDVDEKEEEEEEEGANALLPSRSQTKQHASRQQPMKPIRGSCQCCFEEISSSNSIFCASMEQSNSHSFCRDCVQRYVQEWVFGGADYRLKEHHTNNLPCMAMYCQEGYIPHEAVEGVCSAALWENYQEKIFRAEAVASVANILEIRRDQVETDNWRSHSDPAKVRFGQTDDDSLYQRVLERSNSSSDESNVMVGGKVLVTPERLSGKSVKVEKQTKSLNKVAEAMTQAKVRKCVACDVSFLKESGCNKMKCPGCKAYMCYICRLPVHRLGYDHFCQHAYDSCKRCDKCPLWTRNDERADKARIELVAMNEANRQWEKTLLRSEESGVAVNVDELLKVGGQDKQKSETRRSRWLRRFKRS